MRFRRAEGARPLFPGPGVYLAAITWPISTPMISPEITNSTRRFCCRPAAVSFVAMAYGQNIQPNLGAESKTSKLPAHELSVIIVFDA
jgi:hypothetical protein